MPFFPWSQTPPRREIRRVMMDRPIYVISDLHLGDGSRTDLFMAKDRHLLALIERVKEEDGFLIVAGDALDFAQAVTFTRILKAHGKVLRALSEMADRGRMIYIYGNHDFDMRLYEYLLRFPVVAGVELCAPEGGRPHALVVHGYEYDGVIGPDLKNSELRTMIHHQVERVTGTWIRPPIEIFYTLGNRLSYWLAHKAIWFFRLKDHALAWLGDTSSLLAREEELRYWLRNQLGDPGDMFRPVIEALESGPHEVLICGHSHLPGVVRRPSGRAYANTGSWTFNSATFLRLERGALEVRDWISGALWDDRLYRPIIAGAFDHKTFDDWWDEHYMGLLRFRIGEERSRLRPPWKLLAETEDPR